VRLVTLQEYAHTVRTTAAWTVHRLVPRPGLVVLLGPPKVGKSYLALQLALAVANGRPFLGQPSVPGPVWYLQLDTGEGLWTERLCRMEEAGHDLSGPVFMMHPDDRPRGFNFLRPADQDLVRSVLSTCDPSLVIIDVLRKFHSANENDSTEMKALGDAIDRVFASRSVLVLHHTRKRSDGSDDGSHPNMTNLSRGSSFLTGQADATWLLGRNRLMIESRFDEPTTYVLAQDEVGAWVFPGKDHEEITSNILGLCAEFPEASHNHLATVAKERWGISRAAYYRYLAGRRCAHSTTARASS
jgi:RecA-family ATPase